MNNTNKMRKTYSVIVFILVLAGVAVSYSYPKIFFKKPQSIHKWRQSDCASIALNYYQGGMHFLNPETHNLTSDGGTSGKCLTSEIPILYYSVASLYTVLGYHDSIYRIFNTLLFFLGLFYLFLLFRYLLNDVFWSIVLTILIFTSPVLVYYGNNYLSNSSAFAFSIIGWYYFIRFFKESRQSLFYVSVIFFFIGGALKVTSLFSLIAIALLLLFELLKITKFTEDKKLFNHPLRSGIAILTTFIILGVWLVYANHYNKEHDCYYFSTTIFPIWEMDKAGIKQVIDNVRKVWADQYFHSSVLLFLTFCLLFILITYKKSNKFLFYVILFVFVEVVAYVLLQFMTFAYHDYYTIEMFVLPVLILIGTFDVLHRHFSKFVGSLLLKSMFLLFLVFNVYYASGEIDQRYDGRVNGYEKAKDFYTITPFLREIGILETDTVVSIPDGSHYSLYLMNQKGWTEYTDARFNRGERIHYNQDSLGIRQSIEKGAKYLIINGIEEIYIKPYLKSFCTHLKGRYNRTMIFDLRSKEKNFTPKLRRIDRQYRCDAELIDVKQNFFISQTDSTLFENAGTRSDEFSRSGKYSVKLSEKAPYGMTIKIKDLNDGESLGITCWRKINGLSNGTIIVSSKSYYNAEIKVIQRDSAGWEKLFKEVFIPSELAGQEFGIYLYNPNTQPVYFDDFEIIKYKSVVP